MVRKLEAPLPSPRRRGRFKPTPLNPIVVVEEENNLISPRSPTAEVVDTLPPLPISGEGGRKEEEEVEEESSKTLSATNAAGFHVTSV